MKRNHFFAIAAILLACSLVRAEDPKNKEVAIEISKPMKGGQGLGTMSYKPTAKEKAFFEKVTEKSIDLWSDLKMPKPDNVSEEEWKKMEKEENEKKSKMIPKDKYRLEDQAGEYVGWCGIVRDIAWDKKNNTSTLLIEHKYFDGMTDLHLQIVSIYGAGDFQATLPGKADRIPLLSLVRIYGKAAKPKDGLPTVVSEYIRLWDWGLFSFMDYGKDRSNPKWVKLRKVSGDEVYSSRPDKEFYEERLGMKKTSDKPNADDQ